MSRVVRLETRKRGVFGKLMKLLFILFNVLMVSAVAGLGDGASRLNDDVSRAGYGAGAALGLGFLVFIWAAGDVILGLFVILTRGRKTIVEEVAA